MESGRQKKEARQQQQRKQYQLEFDVLDERAEHAELVAPFEANTPTEVQLQDKESYEDWLHERYAEMRPSVAQRYNIKDTITTVPDRPPMDVDAVPNQSPSPQVDISPELENITGIDAVVAPEDAADEDDDDADDDAEADDVTHAILPNPDNSRSPAITAPFSSPARPPNRHGRLPSLPSSNPWARRLAAAGPPALLSHLGWSYPDNPNIF